MSDSFKLKQLIGYSNASHVPCGDSASLAAEPLVLDQISLDEWLMFVHRQMTVGEIAHQLWGISLPRCLVIGPQSLTSGQGLRVCTRTWSPALPGCFAVELGVL